MLHPSTARRMPSPRAWAWVALAWIGVIFFSSTSLALKWAEGGFSFLSSALLQHLKENTSSYHLAHLLADKGFHVTLFFVFAVLLWLALGRNVRKGWIILLAGAVIGCISEFLQRFFPDRDPALRDVLINTGGTALGLAICFAIGRVRSSRREPACSTLYSR